MDEHWWAVAVAIGARMWQWLWCGEGDLLAGMGAMEYDEAGGPFYRARTVVDGQSGRQSIGRQVRLQGFESGEGRRPDVDLGRGRREVVWWLSFPCVGGGWRDGAAVMAALVAR
jgi:hypothetical protein